MKLTAFIFCTLFSCSVFAQSTSENSESSWTQSGKDAFLKTCVKGVKKSTNKKMAQQYCGCMLDKLIAKYPNPADLEKLTEEEITKIAEKCVN